MFQIHLNDSENMPCEQPHCGLGGADSLGPVRCSPWGHEELDTTQQQQPPKPRRSRHPWNCQWKNGVGYGERRKKPSREHQIYIFNFTKSVLRRWKLWNLLVIQESPANPVCLLIFGGRRNKKITKEWIWSSEQRNWVEKSLVPRKEKVRRHVLSQVTKGNPADIRES